jgi:hypothetical protein
VADEAEAPLGAFPVKKPRQRRPQEVAARVAKLHKLAPATPCQESQDKRPKAVQPLNPGFFALERMRAKSVESKKRTKKRAKAKSK